MPPVLLMTATRVHGMPTALPTIAMTRVHES
jgi:hypothetical protein